MSEQYAVYAPTVISGGSERKVPASPLRTLNNAIVGEIWDYIFRGDEMFPEIREAILARSSSATFVDYGTFGNIHGAEESEVVARLPERLTSSGCNGAIVGVGC